MPSSMPRGRAARSCPSWRRFERRSTTFLSIFATAHLGPRMHEKGTIAVYLSRPMRRVKLLLSRYVAGLLLATSNVLYLLGAVWLIVMWKTHVFHPRFFLAGAIIVFVI